MHVWKICWFAGTAPAPWLEQMKNEGRLQVAANGKTIPWLNPAHPANREMELQAIEELARLSPVDGIHLDYIRYPVGDGDFSDYTRRAFQESLGRKVYPWPDAVSGKGKYAGEFRTWRAGIISSFVRDARQRVKAVNPAVKLSAAVWGSYPDCIKSAGQDWAPWLKDDLLDFVCPMNYTPDLYRFSAWTLGQTGLPGAKGRIIPGLGVTASESQLQPDEVIEQILAVRRLGARGFVLFDLNATLREETLPALRLGVTAAP
jgi:uncharacterized lipoprotein YddW (UPF0748 family)